MQKHSFYIGLIAVMLTACSKSDDHANDGVHVYYVVGTVLDDIDNTPVAGVRVNAFRQSSGWFSPTISSDTVVTDASGAFFIEMPKTTNIMGGSVPVVPTRVNIQHPDYCPPADGGYSIEAVGATTEVLLRIDPKAYRQVMATNTGAYSGAFDEVNISSLGDVTLESGAVTTGAIHSVCYQLENSSVFVRYKLNNSLVHQETYTFSLTRKDTLHINIDY